MSPPIVATKLNPPAFRPQMVARPRLRALLDRSLTTRLTLVSAPAGFGKTTLLAEWLEQAIDKARTTAWLSLDDGDNEPAIFWSHVVTALQSACGTTGARLPDIDVTQPAKAILAVLVNALAAAETPILLIFDDFHLVDRAEIHGQLGFFVERMPSHVHVIMTTRADPQLSLARLRVRGELLEIRSDDLRFSSNEAVEYLNSTMALALSNEDVRSLGQKTEGWIAALQLAALSLAGRNDGSSFIRQFTGSDRYIVDYLVEEVLARQPREVRAFLATTANLRRMNASLCDAVMGEQGISRPILDRLERDNLFLIPLDDQRQWFRYHHLFSDVLLAHLAGEQKVDLGTLHRRASSWFEADGQHAEAIHHVFLSNDQEMAAELLERAIPDMRKYRREALFNDWIQFIPEAIIRSRPILNVGYVGVLASLGRFEGLEERLLNVEAETHNLAEPEPVQVQVELYRSALAQVRGDLDATAMHARRVVQLAAKNDDLTRSAAAGFLGIAAWTSGRLEEAAGHWEACRNGLLRQGHIADVMGTTIALSDIRLTQGRISEAMRLCQEALNLAGGRDHAEYRGAADMHIGLAMLYIERGERTQAREHLVRNAELGEVFGLPQNPYRSRVAEAHLAAAEGGLEEALEHLRAAEPLYVSDFFPRARPIPALIAEINIRLGRLDQAERWAQGRGLLYDTVPNFLSEFEHITFVRFLLAKGKAQPLDQAHTLVGHLLQGAQEGSRQGSQVEIHVLAALVHLARRDSGEAIDALRQAIELAEPEAIRRPFLDARRQLSELLRQLGRHQPSDFVSSLMDIGHGRPTDMKSSAPGLSAPLTSRETNVLRLLQSDLSGPEIAEELAISLNTLRTHTKSIFDKLGVNSRRAAVRQAQNLHLFDRHAGR